VLEREKEEREGGVRKRRKGAEEQVGKIHNNFRCIQAENFRFHQQLFHNPLCCYEILCAMEKNCESQNTRVLEVSSFFFSSSFTTTSHPFKLFILAVGRSNDVDDA
jgi:hypothetical protein